MSCPECGANRIEVVREIVRKGKFYFLRKNGKLKCMECGAEFAY